MCCFHGNFLFGDANVKVVEIGILVRMYADAVFWLVNPKQKTPSLIGPASLLIGQYYPLTFHTLVHHLASWHLFIVHVFLNKPFSRQVLCIFCWSIFYKIQLSFTFANLFHSIAQYWNFFRTFLFKSYLFLLHLSCPFFEFDRLFRKTLLKSFPVKIASMMLCDEYAFLCPALRGVVRLPYLEMLCIHWTGMCECLIPCVWMNAGMDLGMCYHFKGCNFESDVNLLICDCNKTLFQ